jgi:putative flippase GtrA
MLRALILKIPQPIRFITAGGTVAVVYICMTLVLHAVGLPIQLAIAIGYSVGVALQFTLQRYYVFANHDAFSLEIHKQLGRYLPMALTQYGLTVLIVAVVPGLLGINKQVVYVITAIGLALVVYLINRYFVFHGAAAPEVLEEGPDTATAPGGDFAEPGVSPR